MIDRKKGPQIHTDFDLSIKDVETSTLANGIRLIELNTGTQEIVKVELVLKCGRIHESKIGASKAAILLMREGSASMDSSALAYAYDYYGASVKLSPGMEVSSMNLVCMTKFFDNLWPTWIEMVLNPSYPEEEVEKFKTIQSQKLKNQLSKNEVISYRLVTERIFGSEHPYGYNTQPEHIMSLTREDIMEFYDKQVTFEDAIVVVSGRYSDAIRKQIIDSMSSIQKKSHQATPIFNTIQPKGETLYQKTDNELQASIKMGCPIFARKHPDYSAFNFTNTVLGGYFGSRLMTNIREEKGYTYGIYSSLDCWSESGFFYISSDVGSDLVEPTMEEIFKEINILKSEPVPDQEIDMVKNYILGQTLNLIDGPFATAQLVKSLHIKDLNTKDFQEQINIIKNMSSAQVLDMSNKYLDINNFTNVIVGGNKT